MIVIIEHINIINKHSFNNKTINTNHWIYNMYKYLIDTHGFKQAEREDIELNKGDLDLFFNHKFGCIPEYVLSFGKFETLSNIYKKKCSSKIVIIIDDIHHSSRIKKLQNKTFDKSFYILSTYSYIFKTYFGYENQKLINFNHSSAYEICFNKNVINKILLVGHINSSIYPDRANFYNYVKNTNRVRIVNPPKYIQNSDIQKGYVGFEFAKLINEFICTFCDDSSRSYIVAKFFEIPSYGSLLLACNEKTKDEFSKLGFIDLVNYISCTPENWNDKMEFILDSKNREQIDNIRYEGYLLATSKHNFKQRGDFIKKLLV
jgi:hypothetical protein